MINEEAISFQQTRNVLGTNQIKLIAEKDIEEKSAPVAIPVLTPDEAFKANKEVIKSQQIKAIANTFHKYGFNKNRIHLIMSLLPLLFVFDVFLLKKKKKKTLEYLSLPRRVCILFSVSLLAFGLLVFVPWSVYFGNSIQFSFIFQDFVNWNLRILTISIIGTCIVLLLIPPMFSDYLVAVIAGLGLCVYLQAMFMNQHLGTMNGIEPKWDEHWLFGLFNITIWIAIILSSVIFRKIAPSSFKKVISITTGIVLFLEILATTSMVVSASSNVWSRRKNIWFGDGSKQFQLSKDKNVILFVMDALSSGFIKMLFETAPEKKEIVKDFIWYADACSNYHETMFGLSQELTGKMYPPPTNNYHELFEEMWHSTSAESFYKQMKDSGYEARLYACEHEHVIGAEDCYHDYFSNFSTKDIVYEVDYKRLHDCLKQMSAFSSMPYFAKKYFFYAFDFSDDVVKKHVPDYPSIRASFPYANDRFLMKMTSSGISTDANNPILAIYYFRGAHAPWIFDENCKEIQKPFDNPLPTIKSCFYILSEFIRLLKEADVYDNTAILLCSDHGAGDNYYDMSFMTKPFYENKPELTIDDTKVQSIDVLPTLLKMACGDNADFKDFDGYPASNIPNERVRKVYTMARHNNLPSFDWENNSKANGLDEYIFVDLETFKNRDKRKETFVRSIPFGRSSQEDK